MNKKVFTITGLLFLYILFTGGIFQQHQIKQDVIVDSRYTFSDTFKGKDIPENILNNLALIDVEYYSFDSKLHRGQLIIHKSLQKDMVEIFNEIKKNKFPVAKVIPIVKYGWSDEKSMKDNNTSSFNFRLVKGTKVISAHSKGRAIDLNPWLNPQLVNGKTIPAGAEYNPDKAGTITKDSFIVKEFRKRGWQWGGTWKRTKDYQHFEKN